MKSTGAIKMNPDHVILDITQATPAWVTTILERSGSLTKGSVESISISLQRKGFASITYSLDINYSKDASNDLPNKLFLKLSNRSYIQGNTDENISTKEVQFYNLCSGKQSHTYLVPCYSAVSDIKNGACNLLLMDVSKTHESCNDESKIDNCFRAINVLAEHHAAWWDHPRLGNDVGSFPSEVERKQDILDSIKHTTAFINITGDKLKPKWRKNYEKVLIALPTLFQRHNSRKNLTLAHGDSHLGNYLFPKNDKFEKTYLIDWQFWHPTIAGTDTAFLIATEWDSKIRLEYEQKLLHQYYTKLIEHGVDNYIWHDCWNDYRLSIILMCLFIPIWRWAIFKWPVDLLTVEKSMIAFEELKCIELIS
jgi:hypothetical protein